LVDSKPFFYALFFCGFFALAYRRGVIFWGGGLGYLGLNWRFRGNVLIILTLTKETTLRVTKNLSSGQMRDPLRRNP
jgi:hypothetical protein